MVERDAKVAHALRTNAANLSAENCELVTTDALKLLDLETRRFDVIFVDPPYDSHLLPRILPRLLARLSDGGMVYAESDSALEVGPEWQVWRSGSAGQVHYYLLRKAC
jgi:16S rRNA (guanine966-N2)-methyltransferase